MHVNLLELQNTPIFEQLKIEEALLRSSDKNYCIINSGTPPSIVMGISAKTEEVLFSNSIIKNNIPVIKRYSGGGTVIVDPDTIFVSFIFQKDLLNLPLFPEPIMRWSGEFYKEALGIEGFALRENDYVIFDKKCGGNAQYIQKNRFVHHTTFLWNFCDKHMSYLKLPKKTPNYRESRTHKDFLCTLCSFFSKEEFIYAIKALLEKKFAIENIMLENTESIVKLPHRKATSLINIDNT